MTARDEWILFLEKNPQFSELSKSALYIAMLKFLRNESLSIDRIHTFFPRVESKDLYLIIKSLAKLKLVCELHVAGNILYTLTPKGRELLEMYERVKETFKIE
jgi:predicted transcriptional regulator